MCLGGITMCLGGITTTLPHFNHHNSAYTIVINLLPNEENAQKHLFNVCLCRTSDDSTIYKLQQEWLALHSLYSYSS